MKQVFKAVVLVTLDGDREVTARELEVYLHQRLHFAPELPDLDLASFDTSGTVTELERPTT